MRSDDDRRRVMCERGDAGVTVVAWLRGTAPRTVVLAAGLTLAGVLPVSGQGPTEQGRASFAPAEATASPPQGSGMRSAQLRVPSVVLAEPASETKLVIDIDPPEAAPRGSFVRIRGLPPTAALTDGHAIAPGAWAVPTAALKTLRVIVPAGATGRSEIVVALVTLEGSVIAEAKGSLVVAAARLIAPAPAAPKAEAPSEPRRSDPPAAPAQQPAAAPPPPPPVAPSAPTPPPTPKAEQQAALPPPTVAPSAPPAVAPKAQDPGPSTKELSPATKQKAEGLLSRGRALLNDGNVAMARLFFERSADEGLAEGALAMGATYDPAELRRMRVQGTQPDITQARRWYEKARTLGSRDADTRLKDLSGN